jgi:hypothetical protein
MAEIHLERLVALAGRDGVVKRSADVNTVEATDQVYAHHSEVCGHHVNSNKDLLVLEYNWRHGSRRK